MRNNKINLNSVYLIPKLLKNFITESYYKLKFVKSFTLVSMLRNYITTGSNSKKDVHSIIINKNLITKPIDTSNLTTSFIKNTESGTYNIEVYKIVVHINNPFNPTNISLFESDYNFHLYHQYGDNTVHINMGLLTLFKILSSNTKENLSQKSKSNEDYYVSNSNLSEVILNLLKTEIVQLYKKD